MSTEMMMPDRPLPNDPRFGFFDERPDQRLSDDEDQPHLTYAMRQDYELDELERVQAKLDAARQALAEVYENVPVHIQERLERLRVILEYDK